MLVSNSLNDSVLSSTLNKTSPLLLLICGTFAHLHQNLFHTMLHGVLIFIESTNYLHDFLFYLRSLILHLFQLDLLCPFLFFLHLLQALCRHLISFSIHAVQQLFRNFLPKFPVVLWIATSTAELFLLQHQPCNLPPLTVYLPPLKMFPILLSLKDIYCAPHFHFSPSFF